MKVKFTLITIIALAINLVHANPEQGKAEADELAGELLKKLTNDGKVFPDHQQGANKIAEMKYEREPEKFESWQQNTTIAPCDLEKTAVSKFTSDKIGQQLITSERVRPKFDDLASLNFIQDAEKFTQQEEEILATAEQRQVTVEDLESKYIIKTCQHSRKPEEFQCIKYLQDPTVEVIPAKYSNYWCTSGAHRPDDQRCRAKRYYSTPREYQAKQVRVGSDNWVSECNSLAAREAKNECRVIKEECLDNKPHIINGEIISRPCWKYQYTYSCKYPVQQSCDTLLKQGCQPLDSKCTLHVKDKCYIWEQRYKCPVEVKKVNVAVERERAFCQEGECFNTDYPPNDEMLPAISQLSIFASMQQDLRAKNPSIFKGEEASCSKLCLGIKNCCKEKGWGYDLGLVDCTAEEKALAEKRNKKLCVEVGTYCAEKVPLTGECFRKKTTFCCFPTKLTKAVQEQGRGQLGLGFGEAENPNCRGLLPQELAKIDFGLLDLTDAFTDVVPKLKDLSLVQQRLQSNLKTIQADHTSQLKGEK